MNIPCVSGYEVYNDADSKDVENYVLYAKVGDVYLYKDPEFTQKVTCDELRNMFLKGLFLCTFMFGRPTFMLAVGGKLNVGNDNTEYFCVSYEVGMGDPFYSAEYME